MESFQKPKSAKIESHFDDFSQLQEEFAEYLEYDETEEEKKFREETSDFVESVDFDTLNAIFDEVAQRATGSQESNNTGFRIDKKKIRFYSSLSSELMGEANVSDGFIEIKWPELDTSLPISIAIEKRAAEVLHTLIHEGTHVRGGYQSVKKSTDTSLVGQPRPESWVETRRHRVGLRESEVVTKHSYSQDEGESYLETGTEAVGTSLNEAITENIARQLYLVYLTRTGNGKYLKFEDVGGSYQADRLVFSLLLAKLAPKLEVSEEDLWRSFVHAYMSGTVEIQELFNELGDVLNNQPEMIELLRILALNESVHKSINPEMLQKFYDKAGEIGVFDELFLNNLRHHLGIA